MVERAQWGGVGRVAGEQESGRAAYQPLWARLDEADRHVGSQRACGESSSLGNGLNRFKWRALSTQDAGPAHGLEGGRVRV